MEEQLKILRATAGRKTGYETQPEAPPVKAPAEATQKGDAASGADAAAKDAKISALEEQLVENARAFAAQMADLKMKLMEAELGAGDSDSDDE